MVELLIIAVISIIYLSTLYFGVIFGFILALIYGKYYYDQSEYTGCREWKGFRNFFIWKKIHEYFQLKVIYDDEDSIKSLVNSKTPAILAMHPHGIASVSSWIGFGLRSDCNKDQFTDNITITGASINFALFIWRTIALWLGVIRADEEVIVKKLNDEKKYVLIMPGGIREEVHAGRGSNLEFYLKHLGFLRIAIKTGHPVIPIYAKGEHGLFNVVNNRFKGVRNFSIDTISYPFPTIVYGGPFRGPLHIVIGSPIYPSDYDNDLNKLYEGFYTKMAKLIRKYDEHTDNDNNYGPVLQHWLNKV